MLSQSAIEYLDEHGYKTTITEGVLRIDHSASGINSLVAFITLMSSGSLFLMSVVPLIGLIGLVGTLIVGIGMSKRIQWKSHFELDTKDRMFGSKERRWGKFYGFFDDIEEIGYRSRFIQSYATAGKATSEEYEHILFIRLKSGQTINLFVFEGDYLEPPDEFIEIHDSFKRIIGMG